MTCPAPLALSQYLDDELPGADADAIRAHLGGCSRCAGRLTRLARAIAGGRRGLREWRRRVMVPSESTGEGCLSPSRLVAWLDPATPAAERHAAALHIDRCDTCLTEAVNAARLMQRLDEGPPLAVPASLTARVASRWPLPAAEPSLATLVLRVTRAGVELVERHLVAPWRELAEIATPAVAVRAKDPAQELQFQLQADDTRIRATVRPAGDAVGLVLALESSAGVGLADQRVFLRHRGRSIFSARTDASGMLQTPRLERGVYEVSCPGIGTAFRIDLRG